MVSRVDPPSDDHNTRKMLLGDIGLQMLEAIRFGPMDAATIHVMCGIPLGCIEGRIPVLKELDLIWEDERGFFLTQCGIDFLETIRTCV